MLKVARFIFLWHTAFMAIPVAVEAQTFIRPLQTGFWGKFSVTRDGIYKIDYTQLKSAGFNVDKIDPRSLALFGNGSGMLPQANSAESINYLREISIVVVGESDGIFNQDDYILFFGQGPDHYFYNPQKETFHYEKNLYADKNYYFLGQREIGQGNRIETVENISGAHPIVSTFNDFIFHEEEKYNELKSGRKWWGEQFDLTTSLSLPFAVEDIRDNSTIKIVSGVMSQNFNPASFALSLNGTPILEQPIAPIANTQYGIKGRQVIDTVIVSASSVNAKQNATQTFTYQYTKGSSGKSIGYLDFLLASFERDLSLYGNQIQFRSASSLSNPTSTFEISSFSSGLIWDVTDPFNSKNQLFQTSATKATFSTSTDKLKTFIAAKENAFLRPTFEKQIPNQNLRSGPRPSFLIVTHPDFKNEALRLANHRQVHNGISTLVVTTEEIFNDYSGGKQDPTAIRDFVKLLYNNGLRNVLLFGRASYDYKNRVNKNTNFVPTYESRNSLSPLETYSSDDYFAFLEATEGDWSESPAVNHTLDIGVGRLPVKTLAEAKTIVDKLIAYDINPKAFGPWRKEILFVADDGDFNLHQGDADKLARDIEGNQYQFNTQKIYLDAFKQISRPSGQVSPDARGALLKSLKAGTLILNFTGHGSERIWLQEQILDEQLIAEWNNKTVFPLLVTATCEFGRHDDPGQISSSELALTKKDGGAIGLVTAARPVNASTNAFLNNAFYTALFKQENGKYRDIGTVFKETKNNSVNGISNRNFSLLGDPSMHLAIANNKIKATEVTTTNGSDTLKALSKVVIKGEVHTNGTKNENFNGILSATLKDKEFSFKTLGDENPIFTYKHRSNTLFRGQATIEKGSFSLEFILPKNIAYQVGTGKLSLYAKDETNLVDAIGGSTDFKIGESELDDNTDQSSPIIKLYMGDTTFINGGVTSASTQLVARLSDMSGINIANYGVGNNLVAILDNDRVFEIDEYYTADVDDFTKGTIVFPFENLQPGRHSIEVKAWDVYNNPASATVDFTVPKENQLVIEQLYNFPNPFSNSTTIQFAHSRAGEDLEVFATIVDIAGQPVNTITFEINSSPYLVTLPEWDGTNTAGLKLGNGIYLLRLSIRSLLDGSKNEQISKLIILN